MKKYGILVILLLMITAGGIGAAHSMIEELRDDVNITETVLEGDPSVAEGITVTTNTQYNDMPLFWKTSYTVGQSDKLTCEFQYQRKNKSDTEDKYYYELYPEANLYFGPDSEEEYQDPNDEEVGYFPKEAMKQAVAKTKAGTVHKEKILLNDYMKYYEVQLDGSYYDENGFNIYIVDDGQSTQYFHIPVMENSVWNIQVKKDIYDNIISINNVPEKKPYIYDAGTMDDSAVYLFLTDMTAYSEKNEIIEQVKLPKTMCGLHRIPFKKDENNGRRSKLYLDGSNAELVFPMEQGQRVIQPVIAEDGNNNKVLRFFTLSDEKLALVMMNMTTFTVEQTIPLPYNVQEYLPYNFQVMENDEKTQMLIIDDQNQFSFLAKGKDGNYVHILSDTLLRKDPLSFVIQDYKLDWSFDDQGHLILVCLSGKPENSSVVSSSYQLTVYENDQLLYSGFYQNSLDNEPEFLDRESEAQAAPDNPITLSLPSAL